MRDALLALEIWAVFLGWGLARRVGVAGVKKALSIMFGMSLAWFCLYPIQDRVVPLFPVVGVQRPTNLASFTSFGFVAAWALLWFSRRRGTNAVVGSCIAVAVILMATARGVLAGLVLAGIVSLCANPRRQPTRTFVRLGAAAALLLALMAILPPLPGRLGSVTPSTFVGLIESGFGEKSDVSSSYNDRQQFMSATLEALSTTRMGYVFGVGLGRDLTGGFVADVKITKPHNDFLEYFARLGVIGFAPWIGVWIIVFRELFRRARADFAIARWGVAALSVSLLMCLTQPFSSFAYGGMVQWLTMGLVLGCSETPMTRVGLAGSGTGAEYASKIVA